MPLPKYVPFLVFLIALMPPSTALAQTGTKVPATAAAATPMRDTLIARYPGAFMTEVTAEEFGATSSARIRNGKPASQSSTPPASRADLYVVTLVVSETDAPLP